ncbi:ABC transporter ATP-binding protein [Nocardioides massiliensis]|uniref:Peptide/nickel transport system ATP-binding protein/oligopeptide transport system ATP-binding protein n=1 Tax=Nocardioides massiliensis TaxID=1325935 RepID=A0ABT9NN62_9ACTN|nr:ABC transporter ATP-binding protein [Nocardioides massiliensis]MDP9821858.1 peptide/nickel transport system ATP-binding protein/oligopeptide transport system ATP-binding protein [Nocardioides massiliensis]
MALLSIKDLRVHIDTPNGTAHALNGVNIEVAEHEIVGLIGETGAGKSLTAWSVLGLLGTRARVVDGTAEFEGADLVTMPERKRRRLRGKDLAVIVQNPRGALDPLRSVGRQIAMTNRRHRGTSRSQAKDNAIRALRDVGISDPARRAKAFAHQLSGGMAQRVLIALAMINEPKLIIADEPTTGLDLTVQAQILDLLRARVDASGSAVLLITHDLGVVANYCDRVAVMFAGRIVEEGTVTDIFGNPRHPYTRALVAASRETLDEEAVEATDRSEPPNLLDLPSGCHYRLRCRFAAEQCAEPVPLVDVGGGHRALCHFPEQLRREEDIDLARAETVGKVGS